MRIIRLIYQLFQYLDLTSTASIASILTLCIIIYDRTGNKPRVEVKFPNKATLLVLNSDKDYTISFHITNIGDTFCLKKPSAHLVTVFIYFTSNFKIKEVRRDGNKTDKIFQTTVEGRFRNMQYVVVPDVYGYKPPAVSILGFSDAVDCYVDLRTPKEAGTYDVIVNSFSRLEGDYGVKKLKINVK